MKYEIVGPDVASIQGETTRRSPITLVKAEPINAELMFLSIKIYILMNFLKMVYLLRYQIVLQTWTA